MMRPDVIETTMRLWAEHPEQGKVRPRVIARSEGTEAVVEAGRFTFRADEPKALAGNEQSPGPVSYLMGALVTCAVALINDTLAPQLGVRVTAVEATAECDYNLGALLGMGGSPDLQNFELSVRIASPDEPSRVREVYETWRSRCPIYRALIHTLPVSTRLEIGAA